MAPLHGLSRLSRDRPLGACPRLGLREERAKLIRQIARERIVRSRAPRSARAGPARAGPRPSLDPGTRNVTRPCRIRAEREISGRPGPKPRSASSSAAISRCDPRAGSPRRRRAGAPRPRPDGGLAAGERAKAPTSASRSRAGVADEDGRPHRRRPEPVRPAEQGGERLPEPLRAERVVLEQRQLPALKRLAELGVVLGLGQPLEQVGRQLPAPGVEPGRLPRGLGRGDAEQRPDPERVRVSRSKTTGPAATGAPVASRRAVRHRPARRALGRRLLPAGQLSLEGENARPLRCLAEAGWKQLAGLRPAGADLVGGRLVDPYPAGERDRDADRQADEGRHARGTGDSSRTASARARRRRARRRRPPSRSRRTPRRCG